MITFQEIEGAFNSLRVLCIGDILLDRYVMGEAHRLSPEAPVPVLHANTVENRLGGVGNVAHNLSALGISSFLCSVVGMDDNAKSVTSLLKETPLCQEKLYPIKHWNTVEKIRFMAEGKHLLRVDFEKPVPLEENLERIVMNNWASYFKEAQVVILSDYGKGLLTTSVVQKVIDLAKKNSIPVIVDPKSSDFSKYSGSDIITPNKLELSRASGGLSVNTLDECIFAAKKVLEKTNIKGLLVTRGADGMAYITKEGLQESFLSKVQDVHDVSGAGDTVIALMAAGLASGWSMKQTMELASVCAGIVVGKPGTAVVRIEELEEAIRNSNRNHIMTWDQMRKAVQEWQNKGLKVGFTNGCFDIIHKGHLSLLDFAKSKCDKLVIGLNSDLSVKVLKGPKRPVQEESIRGRVLSSLHEVDGVVLFEEETPYKLINKLQPDVLIKGQDYTVDQIAGSDIVLSRGGEVFLAPILDGYSTTGSLKNL